MKNLNKDSLRKKFYGPHLNLKDYALLLSFISKNKLSIPTSSGIVKKFEDGFSNYMGGGESLLTQSGTAAILSSLAALGLKKGDEIIFPIFGFHACIMPARLLGLKIKWAPVRHDNFLLDTDKIDQYITDKTKAIYLIHLFGQPVDMEPLLTLKEKYDFKIFADCSHSFMAQYKGNPAGSLADIAAFSLQQNKFLATGEGGVIWSKNKNYLDRIKALAHPGQKLDESFSDYQGISFGLKFRPHPIVAWLAYNQLQKRESLLQSHRGALKELKGFFKSQGFNFDFLPLEKKDSQPAGYCYLKFRLPMSISEEQLDSFRQNIKEKGLWVKPEHFVLMDQLPKKAPFEFSHFNSQDIVEDTNSLTQEMADLKPLIRRQFAIRLPMTWKKGDLKKHYSHDLELIKNSL